MKFADYELKARERQLVGPEGPVELSSRSFDILSVLLARPNEVVDKSALFDAVWPGVVVEENTLQVHVSSLRKLLGPGLISTVHGRGYKYVGPPPQPSASAIAAPAPSFRGNVPEFRVECVSRLEELAEVGALLAKHRLVSILGPGGVGKTTLAIEVASRLATDYADGVWLIDLAPVNGPDHVAGTLLGVFGIPLLMSRTALETLAENLRDAQVLIVLDNCEHLVDAVRDVVTRGLAGPRIRVMATSQIPLGLPEERIFKLTPFATAAGHVVGDRSQSAEFFRHCYESFGEKVDDSEWHLVTELCRHLDGVALALKMAAARAAAIGIATVTRQIDSKLGDLSAPWPSTLPRQKSLVAALSWSHGLLNDREKRAFHALSAFSGSFTVEAAAAVCGEAESLPELVRKSLVVRDGSGNVRYRLLETARHFASDHLGRHGERQAVLDRHAAYVTGILEASLSDWETLTDRQWLSTYAVETENLRSALAWLGEPSRWKEHARLCAAAYRLWLETGQTREGLARSERALEAPGLVGERDLDSRLRVGLAEMCRAYSRDLAGTAFLEPALSHYRASGSRSQLAQVLSLSIFLLHTKLRTARAHAEADELAVLVRDMEASKLKALALVAIGLDLMDRGDLPLGLARCELGLAMHWAKGNIRSALRSGLFTGELLYRCGDSEKAIHIARKMLNQFQQSGETGYKLERGYLLANLASYHLSIGRADAARELLFEAVEEIPQMDGFWQCSLIQIAAAIEAEAGDPRRAARIFGFVDHLFEAYPDGRQNTEQIQCNRIVDRLRSVLPHDELAALLEEGRSLSHFEAALLTGFPFEGVPKP